MNTMPARRDPGRSSRRREHHHPGATSTRNNTTFSTQYTATTPNITSAVAPATATGAHRPRRFRRFREAVRRVLSGVLSRRPAATT